MNIGKFAGIGISLILVVESFIGWNPEVTSTGFGIIGALILYYLARLTEAFEEAVEGDSSD